MRFGVPSILMSLMLALSITSSAGAACRCSNVISAETADVIFMGSVSGIESPSMFGVVAAQLALISRTPPSQGITFAVERAWRGVRYQQITVRNGDLAGCGVPFVRGEQYLVYGWRLPDGQIATNLCTPSRPAREAHDELAVLAATPTSALERMPFSRLLLRLAPLPVLVLLLYWWLFMVRSIRRSPQRF